MSHDFVIAGDALCGLTARDVRRGEASRSAGVTQATQTATNATVMIPRIGYDRRYGNPMVIPLGNG